MPDSMDEMEVEGSVAVSVGLDEAGAAEAVEAAADADQEEFDGDGRLVNDEDDDDMIETAFEGIEALLKANAVEAKAAVAIATLAGEIFGAGSRNIGSDDNERAARGTDEMLLQASTVDSAGWAAVVAATAAALAGEYMAAIWSSASWCCTCICSAAKTARSLRVINVEC